MMPTKLEECASAIDSFSWSYREDPRFEASREESLATARAVIRCLMEPSDAMIEAGGGNYVNLERADDPSYEPPDILRAMLQSVLDEGK